MMPFVDRGRMVPRVELRLTPIQRLAQIRKDRIELEKLKYETTTKFPRRMRVSDTVNLINALMGE